MVDKVVISNIYNRGIRVDQLTMNEYNRICSERYLDGPPKRLTINRAEDIMQFGCRENFAMTYRNLKSSYNLEAASISMNNLQKYLDIDVYVVLQTLIREGVSCIEEKSLACFEYFRDIVMIPESVITVGKVIKLVQSKSPTEFYSEKIKFGILDCLSSESDAVHYWVQQVNEPYYYVKAQSLGKQVVQQHCLTIKDVDKFLKQYWTDAKKDKEFMDKLQYKKINKYLLGMLYYLKDIDNNALYAYDGDYVSDGGK